MEKRNRRTAAAVLVALALLVGIGTEVNAQQFSRRNPFVEAVEKTRPSIVTVKVDKRGNWGKKEVIGTGVIVDERGYIVTNSHVVSNGEGFIVVLSDGTEVMASVYAEDASHDLAILQIKSTKKLKALPFAPASDLMVGETVMAVGHPYGYRNTVSTGIVSAALNREIGMPSGATLTSLIQTNTSINPGNSGGPLMNINGELIGINVALREGAQGIAFALNSDMVQKVLAEQLSAAKVAKVKHGLVVKEKVTSEVAEKEDGARQEVVIEQVADKSPAAVAGLKRGDVLQTIGGRSIINRFDLERALWDHKSGEKIKVEVKHEGKDSHVSLTLTGATQVAAAARE